MIEDFAKLIPGELLKRSGSVFYSGRLAFGSSAQLYILGLNPGGDPIEQADETVEWHTAKVLRDERDDWSAYRDDSWAGFSPGKHGMQPRVLHLLGQLQLDPGQIPASNIVFLRSPRESLIDGNIWKLAELCWPFHQRVIEELGVRLVLCFGRTAGNWVRRRLDARDKVAEFVEENNRKWRSSVYTNRNDMAVVDATHPSIADWTSTATDPSKLVKSAISKVKS